MTHFIRMGFVCILMAGLSACGASSSGSNSTPVPSPSPTVSAEKIKVNQVGFLPGQRKIAIVPAVSATQFSLLDATNNAVVYSGDLSAATSWVPAGSALFKKAEFSAWNTPGKYTLRVTGVDDSVEFEIAHGIFEPVHDAALKAYYYNRASTALTSEFAGEYARPLGHPDTTSQIHSSAASIARPAGTVVSSPRGWYDAGDYGKYIVNSGISTYTLMAAYEQFPAFYAQRHGNIPESTNSVPDILDEVKWNLDWMETMQDPNDGGVYHKLSTENFAGAVMPHEGTAQRYFAAKSTAATLDFAAVMAVAGRIYSNFNTAFPGKAETYRQAAIAAYEWALLNPQNYFNQAGTGINTGAYGDNSLNDEFSWAAAELYLLTQDQRYLADFKALSVSANTPSWGSVAALGFISLAINGQALLEEEDYSSVVASLQSTAASIVQSYENSSYEVAMENNHFVWGSNSVALNQAMMLLVANQLEANSDYIKVVQSYVDYILGRNPTDYSFITGTGDNRPMHPHHRPSQADSIEEPVPGWIVGGPQPGQQDRCSYSSSIAARSYVDDWCSYASNEVAINWNAPLVYVLAGVSQ